jgi:uncharacterized protein with HEPN domain
MRNNVERLVHMFEAIESIEKYTRLGREEYDKNELIQNWILHHLQIIGEVSNYFSNDFYLKYSQIPWKSIIPLRNILVHQYFMIDLDLIWTIAERDVPLLKNNLVTIMRHIENSGDSLV